MIRELNTKAPLLTPGELQLIKLTLIMAAMLDVLQRDMDKIADTNLKLSMLYILSLDKTRNHIHSELPELKAELRERGIKIYEEVRTAAGIQAAFMCRGYDHKLLLRWETVRAIIMEKGSHYLGVELAAGGEQHEKKA